MIFVTGGTGLVGSRLLYDLTRTGRKVRALKRKSSDLTLVRRYFSGEPDLFQHIEWVEGDVNDLFSLEDGLQGIREVYHCAAFVSFRSRDARRLMKVNAEGTANLINVSLANGVEGFCYVSSTAALGRTEENSLITEDTSWKNSSYNSNYAISKHGAERGVWRGIEEGLPAFVVNPSIVLGPGNPNEGSTALFGAAMKRLKFYTPGSSGFVDVRDVSLCMIQLMDKKVQGERYILNSENISYREILNRMMKCFQKPKPVFRVTPFLAEAGWRAEALRSFFSSRKSLLTKETARNGLRHWRYSNQKIKSKLNMEFIPVSESVEYVCKELLSRG